MAVLGLRSMWSSLDGLMYCMPGIDPIAERKSFERLDYEGQKRQLELEKLQLEVELLKSCKVAKEAK